MRIKKVKNFLGISFTCYFLVFVLSVFLSAGCSPPPGPDRASAVISIQTSDSLGRSKIDESKYSISNISSVSVKIQNVDKDLELVASQDLLKKDGQWTDSIHDLPVAVNLKFTAYAYNDVSEEIYSGSTTQELHKGENTVDITINPVGIDDENFPELTYVTSLDDVGTSQSIIISFEVKGLEEEIIFYKLSLSEGGGSFAYSSGSIDLVAGVGKFEEEYSAPDTAGTYNLTVEITNSFGNQLTKEFEITVIEKDIPGINVKFSPVIVSLIFKQEENLQMTANVLDSEQRNFSYLWKFDGDGNLNFVDNSTNPALLKNYKEGVQGKITLTVTDVDANVSNSIPYNLAGRSFETQETISVGTEGSYHDLVISDPTVIEGGRFRSIHVINDGDLTINGNVFVDDILVRWGKITINGDLNGSQNIVVEENISKTATLTINGSANSVSKIDNSGLLQICNVWNVDDIHIRKGGKIQIISPGTVDIFCNNLVVEEEAELSAYGVGADPRGLGAGYKESGGGGYGGKGGKGYWGQTHPGETYGDIYSYIIDEGSKGGCYGGGRIFILSKNKIIVSGIISVNGRGTSGAWGAGSGGGILIDAKDIELTGLISANGGVNISLTSGGGGGAGRIKLFYDSGIDINILDHLSVAGGWGYSSGADGTVYIDAKPKPSKLISPENNITVNATPTFKFQVIDESFEKDDRDDDLLCSLLLSKDNFVTIYKKYDQKNSLSGWSQYSYKSGDEAVFTPEEPLPSGTYQWKVITYDRSVGGECSDIWTFAI